MLQLFNEKKGEVFNVNALVTNRLHTLEAKLYRGGKILLFNAGRHYYLIQKVGPIAQLILEKVSLPILTKVDELPPTNRGEKGCGSHSVNILHNPKIIRTILLLW